MNDLVSAEWLKLRTTRLLFGTIPAAVAISIAAVAGTILSGHAAELGSAEGIRRVFSVTGAGAIVVLVVGVLVATGEFRHGTAVDTFLTTPGVETSSPPSCSPVPYSVSQSEPSPRSPRSAPQACSIRSKERPCRSRAATSG